MIDRSTTFAACASLMIASPTPGLAASFTPLGDLPGGELYSTAYDVSGDGQVVVGTGTSSTYSEAFRWTAATGMVSLGGLTRPGNSTGEAVSADGTTIVGLDVRTAQGYSWTSTGGMVGLGTYPPGAFSEGATDVSADGSVIVGISGGQAVLYSGGTITGLGTLPGDGHVSASFGISGDGHVAVGFSDYELIIPGGPGEDPFTDTVDQAVAWFDEQIVGLGDLDGGDYYSRAYAASFDGSIIVGSSIGSDGYQAFRWTSATGMLAIGGGNAKDISADGRVIVGTASFGVPENNAAIWIDDSGPQQIWALLVAQGVTGLDGWVLGSAEAVSADGRTVVGWGYSTADYRQQAWVASLDITPIPLPPTLALLFSALGLLSPRQYNRRK
jgi:probable HAF family extracellular repeat protein